MRHGAEAGAKAMARFDLSWVSKIWRCIKLRLGRKCVEQEEDEEGVKAEVGAGELVQHKTSRRVVCLSNVNDVI